MADTKADTKSETKPMKSPKCITLARSGKKVVFDEDYTALDTIAAQKAAGRDTSAFPLYLAQRICLFDGTKMTIGEIRELSGRDYLQLVGDLLGDKADAGDLGNGQPVLN